MWREWTESDVKMVFVDFKIDEQACWMAWRDFDWVLMKVLNFLKNNLKFVLDFFESFEIFEFPKIGKFLKN